MKKIVLLIIVGIQQSICSVDDKQKGPLITVSRTNDTGIVTSEEYIIDEDYFHQVFEENYQFVFPAISKLLPNSIKHVIFLTACIASFYGSDKEKHSEAAASIAPEDIVTLRAARVDLVDQEQNSDKKIIEWSVDRKVVQSRVCKAVKEILNLYHLTK